MSLFPVLTAAGRNALQAAQGLGSTVKLTTAALGSASRVPNGVETTLVAEVCRAPIGGYALNAATGQLDLGAVFTSAALGITADHTVCEVGFFDAAGELIYYYATNQGSLGSITAQSDYALTLSVVLVQADATLIQVVSDGSAQEVVLLPRVAALEAKATALPADGSAAAKQSDVAAMGLDVAAADQAIVALQARMPAAPGRVAAQSDLAALSGALQGEVDARVAALKAQAAAQLKLSIAFAVAL